MDWELIVTLLLTLFAAAVLSFAITPLVRRFAGVIGAIDVPLDDRRMHKSPVPRLGGLAIFAGFMFSTLVFSDLNMPLRGILIGAVIIVVLGCVDDVVRLHYAIKLVFQLAAALVVVLHGLVIDVLANPLFFWFGPEHIQLGVMSAPFTIIWIMALTNAVNFIDGLDGLACGVSLIGSVSLLVIALVKGSPEVALLMAALCGGCLGFLPFNLNPAKLFMGDTGATFLGFILATASIQGLFKMYAIISFAVPFLILGLPIFDIFVSVFRRLFSGKSPAHADRSHIHHRLIDMGFSQKQAVTILYVISAILGLTAVVLTTAGEVRAIMVLLAVMVAVTIGYTILRPKAGAAQGAAKTDASEPEENDAADPDSAGKKDK